MKLTKGTLRRIIKEESRRLTEKEEYKQFFKRALEKAGKSIPQMSDSEKKEFFNKIDKAWKGKNESVVSEKKVPKKGSPDYHQHKIAVDTVRNPIKSFMGGPSWKEAEETLIKKFGYSKKEVDKLRESVNEDTKKRFDVDFYKGNGDRQTSHEEIIRGDKFSDVVSQATKVAKSKGMNYVEFYHKDSFIGSIDKRNGYQFKKGRNYQKSPLPVNEAKSQDPTLKEMVKFLKSNYRDEEEFSILLAIYFYSEANYGGMRSNLYSALSQLSNKMRVRTKFSDERGTEIEMMVDDLVDEFGGERP